MIARGIFSPDVRSDNYDFIGASSRYRDAKFADQAASEFKAAMLRLTASRNLRVRWGTEKPVEAPNVFPSHLHNLGFDVFCYNQSMCRYFVISSKPIDGFLRRYLPSAKAGT